ncbi:1-acyl-sn-glycerol-3-phosphate acyltransferase [Micromonospora sp. 15K316]|uniref:lysophospholipid acyltransferase family protein n=1 Tax=Micromonospora sp. 15K316 TaxID=2530376 RepID=UPI00104A9085|nr:lysophospholipid acyltransferase family protein [Micromonospora sp. 15K316]TDC36052.1 1-acyl-sn-glycerol-3-phosphate acyltransferase [Micromonospora sp. 15K316]
MTAVPFDLWRPRSGCDDECLPAPGETPAVPVPRQVARLLAGVGMLLLGTGLAVVLPVLPARDGQAAVRAWARRTARAFGVRLVVRGRPPRRRALVAANHMSWLDILVVLAVAPTRMVAKRELRSWPLIGLLAAAAGTVFVDRSRPRALPAAVRRAADALRAGRAVAVFPEGTTWCAGEGAVDCRPGGGFRPAMFQAAIDAGAPVVPLRIAYRCAATGESTTAAAFLGEETLLRSVRRVIAGRGIEVTVTVAAALHPSRDADRRVLARAAESAVHLVPVGAVRSRRADAPVPVALPSTGRPVRPSRPAAGGLDLAA